MENSIEKEKVKYSIVVMQSKAYEVEINEDECDKFEADPTSFDEFYCDKHAVVETEDIQLYRGEENYMNLVRR
jgi:hypothetical protein